MAIAEGSIIEAPVGGAFRELKEFFVSLKVGARIIMSNRKFSWLIFGYTLPLILHRLIETVIFPTYAKKILKDGSLSGILLGASNFGKSVVFHMIMLHAVSLLTPSQSTYFQVNYVAPSLSFVLVKSFRLLCPLSAGMA